MRLTIRIILDKKTAVMWLLLLFPLGVKAYIGPGLGVGTIAVVVGILGSIFLALFAVLWYPFKRLLKRRRSRKEETGTEGDDSEKTDSES